MIQNVEKLENNVPLLGIWGENCSGIAEYNKNDYNKRIQTQDIIGGIGLQEGENVLLSPTCLRGAVAVNREGEGFFPPLGGG